MRIVMLLFLIAVTCSVGAAWEEISRDSAETHTIYVDRGTIRHSGGIVTIWVLRDYKDVKKIGRNRFLSARMQLEYDCSGERSRIRYLSEHSGHMGDGSTILASSDGAAGEWSPVAPGSVGRAVFDFACGNAAADPTVRDFAAKASVSYGTAFFVLPQGHALTNSHVTEGCGTIVARLDTGPQEAQVIRRDKQNDLALIRVSTARAVPFASFRGAPAIRAGEGIVAVGYPLPTLLQNGLNVTLGNVSALAGLGGNASFMQMTAPVQPGNSGGPLLDMAGNVVGVVVGKLDAARVAQVTGDIPQNVNFAVQGALARLFLEAGGINVTASPSNTERRVGDVSDLARTFTFQVECRP